MWTDEHPAGGAAPVRRCALVLAAYDAGSGAPPGIDPAAFATACLADTYEVLADLVSVESGVVGDHPGLDEMIWPGAIRRTGSPSLRRLAADLAGRFDELVVVPADVPDLPGLVLAKVFKALQRADVVVAPQRAASGCTALGVRLPWSEWLPDDLDLDDNPAERLAGRAPNRRNLAIGPDWHRMSTPESINRLDPGLEGWEYTRALLAGRALTVES